MISICITVHQHLRAVEMLRTLVESAMAQDYPDKEIIVSDDSQNDDVYNYCRLFFDARMNPCSLHYVRNPRPGKSSINMNNAINHASGDIIKPMFGDDYFVAPDTLSRLAAGLYDHWGVCTSTHNNDRADHVPYPHRSLRELALGENTYGCPSAVIFKKTDLRFDEELIWLMDCEFYAQMYQRYGYPSFISEVKVGIREWGGQVSNTAASGSVRVREAEYVGSKYR